MLIVAFALWATVFQLRLPSRLPTDADYQAVQDVLSREAQPGDVVLLYPWWTERARLFVPESVPVVGHLNSDAQPLLRHPRIWVLAQPNLPESDLEEFEKTFGPERTRMGETRTFGNLELTLYRNGRYHPATFSAVDELANAQVYLEDPNGNRIPCPIRGDRFQCPGAPHLYVRAEWREVFYQPRHCLWMHPPGGARKLVVEFPSANLGTRGELEAGYIWDTFARNGPSNTTTTVRVEDGSTGQVLANLSLPPGTEGLQRASVSGSGEGRSLPLRLTVQSQGNDARWMCVDFLAQDTGGAP